MDIFIILMSIMNIWICYNIFLIAPLTFQLLAVVGMSFFHILHYKNNL